MICMCMLIAGEKFNDHSIMKSVRMDVYSLLGRFFDKC